MRPTKSQVLGFNAHQLSALLFILFVLILVLSACGGGGSGGDTGLLGGGLSTGEVRPLVFDENNTASMAFDKLSGNEEFSVLTFSASTDARSFDVELQSLSDLPEAKFLSQHEEETTQPEEEGGDLTAKTHAWLREEEARLANTEPLFTGKAMATEATVPCADGRGVQMKVLDSLSTTSSFTTTCAIKLRQTGNAIYYVDEEVINDISGETLDRLISDFERKIDLERSILGRESDIDKDGLFSVYFTPAVNRLGDSGGGFVTGFFFGIDLFPRESSPASNEREILYICVPGNFGTPLSEEFWESNIAPTVLPHEFQHMISFNNHVLLKKGNAEISSFNEGLSHFLEDLSPSTILDQVSVENPSRVSLFLNAPEKAAFTSGISIAQRGGAYLFFRYLYEQANLGRFPNAANGSELLKNLIQTDLSGVENVETATGMSFKDLLLDFYATLQLSNTGITEDTHYNFRGINLHASQEDNRGTVLDGVHSQVIRGIGKGSVSSPGGLFFELSGDDIVSSGQGISLVAAQGMIPGGAVIRLR